MRVHDPLIASEVKVRYAETDQMGIAHHANYLVWFEIGRTDLCRAAALPYSEIEQRGFLLVVTGIECKYRRPFLYDDTVVIQTTVGSIASRAFRFDYVLSGSDGETRATGSSSHIWLTRDSRRPVKPPADLVAAFARFAKLPA